MIAYYNEIDLAVAQWLRNLIEAGHIAPGIVDTRSIEDVHPNDLRGFIQCHFFAGIGVWSHALRRAGWVDSRPVWTGSCPCQPFSSAGAGAGFADERHLWPAFHHLIEQCRPATVLGEQVASKDANPWIDLVQTDLEALDYRVGAIAFPAASVGAPHIRDRLYWVADTNHAGLEGRRGVYERADQRIVGAGGLVGGLADANSRVGGQRGADIRGRTDGGDAQPWTGLGGLGVSGGLADASSERRQQDPSCSLGNEAADGPKRRHQFKQDGDHVSAGDGEVPRDELPGPTNGLWRDADWLLCRDGKWRPVSPKPQPLVDGSAESLGRVRAETIEEIEGEINAWSMESQIDRDQALRDLLGHFGTQSHNCWQAGRIPELREAPFLLAFLRQLAQQGWGVAQCLPLSCEEIAQASLRGVRRDGQPAGAPRQYGLEEQQSGEYSDVVPFLSSLLARHALTEWDDAFAAYAETGFPLAHNARSRVARLRAYGNAINSVAAQAFIESVMESSE